MPLLVCNLSQECIWWRGRALAQCIFLPTCPPVLGHPQTQHEGPEVCSPMVAWHWPLRAPSFMVFGYKNGSTTFLKLIFQSFLRTWLLVHFARRRECSWQEMELGSRFGPKMLIEWGEIAWGMLQEKWEIQKHLERVSVYAHVYVYACLCVGVCVLRSVCPLAS